MKNIGIITILKVNNYGAELQAFALQHVLNQKGYHAEIIDYLFYKHPDFKNTKGSKPIFPLSKVDKLKEFLFPYIQKIKAFPYRKIYKDRNQKFYSFHHTYTKISKSYSSVESLYQAKHEYDIFMVGSDQVWNPNNNSSIEPYLLTFAPEDKPKIAYASSFGVGKLDDKFLSYYKERLSKFSAIGTRESYGKRIIEENLNLVCDHVLDPTLLLNKSKWLTFSQKNKEEQTKPYLLIYTLKDSEYINKVALKIASELGLNILRICKNASKDQPDEKILDLLDLGPQEYLHVYANASFVITTSFHGTCFSINFNKPFFVITPNSKNNNSRIQSILEDFSLENRCLQEGEFPNNSTLRMDFDVVNQRLEKRREESLNFLLNSIEQANGESILQ